MNGSQPHHVVVMGVTGSGKSTVARSLADRLGYEYGEGDDFHSPSNVAKMSDGIPLEDDDRWPWLHTIAAWIREHDAGGWSTSVACSALKRRYRDVLRDGAAHAFFVHLTGPRELLLQRTKRRNHFMPSELLDSQLADLEPLQPDERGVVVDVSGTIAQTVSAVIQQVSVEA